MRAAEHQRVHPGALQWLQVPLRQTEHLATAGNAALDEVDEAGAGHGGDLRCHVQRRTRPGTRREAMVAWVPITPIRPLRVAATARRTAGRITSMTGTS